MHDKTLRLRGLAAFLEDLSAPDRPAAVDPLERRADPRFVPLEHRGWMVTEVEEGTSAMGLRVLDIGRGGALVECGEAPRPGEAVSFYLGPFLAAEDEVPAWVVGISTGPTGRPRARLEFRAPCPDHVLERAIRAPEAAPASQMR